MGMGVAEVIALSVALLGAGTVALTLFVIQLRKYRKIRSILSQLLTDLERNAYLLTPVQEPREGASAPVRRIEVQWPRANLEAEAWWSHRSDLWFLPEDLERRLRYFVLQVKDVNRKFDELRYQSPSSRLVVREKVGTGILNYLEEANRALYRDLKEQIKRL